MRNPAKLSIRSRYVRMNDQAKARVVNMLVQWRARQREKTKVVRVLVLRISRLHFGSSPNVANQRGAVRALNASLTQAGRACMSPFPYTSTDCINDRAALIFAPRSSQHCFPSV
jgi:hypothetical protein